MKYITKWVEDTRIQDYLYDKGIKPHFISQDGAAAYYRTKEFKQAIYDYSVWQCFKTSKKIYK